MTTAHRGSAGPALDADVLLRILRGSPTPEEVAAATAALLGLARRDERAAAEDPAGDARRAAGWDRPARPAHRGATSWRR
jgi:hypothetical protein